MSPLNAMKVETPDIKHAEKNVKDSSADFENAMEHLEEKVQITSRKVQRWIDLSKRPKQILIHSARRTRSTVSPLLIKGRRTGESVIRTVKENPHQFKLGAVAIFCGALLGKFAFRKGRD